MLSVGVKGKKYFESKFGGCELVVQEWWHGSRQCYANKISCFPVSFDDGEMEEGCVSVSKGGPILLGPL